MKEGSSSVQNNDNHNIKRGDVGSAIAAASTIGEHKRRCL
jgi:hypothetical protein